MRRKMTAKTAIAFTAMEARLGYTDSQTLFDPMLSVLI